MKYGGLEFPSNPETLKAEISSASVQYRIHGAGSIVKKISDKPCTVSGKGIFYSDNAKDFCARLARASKKSSSQWLLCPGVYPFKAYLDEFGYSLDCKSGGVSYYFKFTEDCGDVSAFKRLRFAIACEGENAFDIAHRCGVSVDDIMRLNELETPFDITAGRRIRINEDNGI